MKIDMPRKRYLGSNRYRQLLSAILFIGGWSAMSADAAVETFSERAVFEGTLGIFELQDFQSVAGTNLCNPFSESGPFCGGGPVELDAGELSISARAQPYIAPGTVLLTPELRFGVSSGGQLVTGAKPAPASNFFVTLEISANGPLTAFGSDTQGWGKDIEVTLLDESNAPINETLVLGPPSGEPGFFGLISDVPFTTVRIRSGNDDFVNYDNMAYKPVPLPPGLLFFGSSLACLAGLRLCRGKRDT